MGSNRKKCTKTIEKYGKIYYNITGKGEESMFEKLETVEKRYVELTEKISDPAIIANNNEWRKLVKEHSSMEDVVLKYREYKQVENNMKEAKEMMEDKEMKELAEEEYYSSKAKLEKI